MLLGGFHCQHYLKFMTAASMRMWSLLGQGLVAVKIL
jgi:hypothetical protein